MKKKNTTASKKAGSQKDIPKKSVGQLCDEAGAAVRAHRNAFRSIALLYIVCSLASDVPDTAATLLKETATESAFPLLTLSSFLMIVSAVAGAFFVNVLMFGFVVSALTVTHGGAPSRATLFAGFRQRYGQVLGLSLLNMVFTFLWGLLLFVPGIVKAISYRMSYYILAEHPAMSVDEARKQSIRLMKKQKGAYVKLWLTTVGWYTLLELGAAVALWCLLDGAVRTMAVSALLFVSGAVAYLTLCPKLYIAEALFYENIKDHQLPRGTFDVAQWQ